MFAAPLLLVAFLLATPVWAETIPREAAKFAPTLTAEIRRVWGLEADRSVFFGQVHQESRWNASARSRFASGLGQFTPGTAEGMQRSREMKDLCGDPAGCPTDPRWALRALVLYDRSLWLGRAFAEGVERLALMLADYNGGAGWINRERAVCFALPPEGRPRGCNSKKYFWNIELQCGKSKPGRAAWACAENTHYPYVIIYRWAPLYAEWLKH